MKLKRLGKVVGLGWGEKMIEGKEAEMMAGNALKLATQAGTPGRLTTQLGFNVSFATNADLASAIPTSGSTDFLAIMATTGAANLTNLSPVARIKNLTALYIWNLCGVKDLSPLAGLSQLTQLSMKSCTEVSDLSPLAKLKNLRYLDISGCEKIRDISPVQGLPQAVKIVRA